MKPPTLGNGIFTASDAAKILGIRSSQAGYWFRGYARKALEESNGHQYHYFNGENYSIDFLTLIEMYVFYALRAQGIGAAKIVAAHKAIGEVYKTPHPFAHKNLLVSGKNLIFEHFGDFVQADGTLQYAINEIILPFCKQVDYGDDLIAERFFPLGKERLVVVDPSHQLGSPTLQGTNILVETVFDLYSAGESIDFLANIFDVGQAAINDAIEFAKAA